MRGFQPNLASPKKQHYADGGLVSRIKSAMGFAPKDERPRAPAPAPAPSASPAPAPAPSPANDPAKAVSQYAASSALKRRMAEIDSYANGGPVRGPGTGTSDEVPDEVPEGTYIMPTDSTQAIGEQNLSAMGARGFSAGKEKIPVQLSNGEFKLPPEQVHAIGVQALDQMKDSTHAPVTARGFAPGGAPVEKEEPRLFFVNGGVVDEEARRRALVNQIPTGGEAGPPATAPAIAPTSPRFMPGTRAVFNESGKAIGDLASEGRYGAAAGEAARAALAYVPAVADDVIGGAGRAVAPAVSDTARQFLGVNGTTAPISPPTAAAAPKPTPSATAQPSGASAQGDATMPALDVGARGFAIPGNSAAPASQNNIAKTVDAQGRTTYSGTNIGPDATINNKEAGGGYVGVPGATARGFASGAPGIPGGIGIQTPMGDFQSADNAIMAANLRDGVDVSRGTSGGGGPRGFVIGTDPAAGRERRNLVDSLTSPMRGAQNGQLTAAQRNGMLQLADQEARGAQAKANNATALQQTEMQTATQRDTAAMRESGDNGRAVLREAGETGRSNARNAIDQGRLSLEQQSRGFEIRDGQRKEKLYEAYDAAKTPEERTAVAQQIRDLSGKQAESPWKLQVTPTIKNMDGSTSEGNVIRYNGQTGQAELVDLGRSAPAAAVLPKIGDTKNGYRYKGGNPNEQGNWEKV